MAPTSRTERRRWNPDGNTKDQSKDGTTTAQEAKSDFDLNGELLRRTLSELFGRVGDEDEDEREDDRSDIGVLLPHSLPLPSPSLPPPLQIPPSSLINILPLPKTDPPPAAPPPQQPLPSSSSILQPPPSIPPPSSSILPPSSSVLPPSSSVPPQQSATGISGNFASPSPPASPRRTTLSAALPQSTGSGDDGGDDGDGGSTSSTPSPTRSTFSTSTRSILSLTPAIAPYYETQSTETDGPTTSISSTESTTRSLTTSTSSPVQTSETTTRTETSMTSISSPSVTAAIGQGGEAGRTSRLSPGGEKAVIASVTIVGFFILLALAWFLWHRSSNKRKAAGRKRTWPANFSSREILEAPRRVSSKVGEKATSMKSHLRQPSALSLCGIDDDDAPKNEKPTAPAAAKAGGLLQRRLGNSASPHRITVNSYGMIFRKPRRDSALSDIFLPTGQPRMSPQSPLERGRERGPPQSSPEGFRESVSPPSPEEIRIPIVRTDSRLAAAAHLENARKSVNTGTNSTPRSPLRRNHRVSNVSSSLSSGFGDGDIVIIQPPTAAAAVKTANTSVMDLDVNVVAVRSSPERKHFSSRFSRNRDTVLTNESGSDDMHPRFRSISSWVGQQSRRVRRAAASRNEDGVPNVPDILPEQGFDMMMPDGQEPRRVESSMYIK